MSKKNWNQREFVRFYVKLRDETSGRIFYQAYYFSGQIGPRLKSRPTNGKKIEDWTK